MIEYLAQHPFLAAIVATAFAGFFLTTLGAVPVLFLRSLNERTNNLMLSFAAGVMLAATFFSLLIPAIDRAKEQIASPSVAVLTIVGALLLGGATLTLINRFVPHEHFVKGVEGGDAKRLARIWLFVTAITLHNFPEGLSVGVSAASGDVKNALGVAFGIGLQNIPEGLSVAIALLSQGYTRRYALYVAALTGLLEIVGGAVGAGVLLISSQLLPYALAYAAGAMLWVISDEIIPETHRVGLEDGSTAALFGGFSVMMFLDATLGG